MPRSLIFALIASLLETGASHARQEPAAKEAAKPTETNPKPKPKPEPAKPAPPPPDFRAVFLSLDVNGDTVLERDEVPDSGRAAFDRLLARGDSNKNGKLEADEMRSLGAKLRSLQPPEALAKRFDLADKDKDGKLSREEFPGIAARFDRIDSDKDGFLSRQEASRAVALQDPPPAPTPPRPAPANRPALVFAKFDKDGDGKLSRAEFPREKLFDRFDKDKDGFLSRAEAASIREAIAPAKP